MPEDETALTGQQTTAPKHLGIVLVCIIAGLWILGFATNASSPKLLTDNPLLLMALNPKYRYMVVAAPEIDPVRFFLIGWGRLLLSDPVYFALGWFFGDRAIKFFSDGIGEPTVESTRRMFLRAATVMALFFAGPVICVLAGAARMKPKRFFTLDLIGTAMIVIALRMFSKALDPVIQSFLRFNERYWKWLMIITVVSTVVVFLRVGRKQLSAAKNMVDDLSD
jgi:membrane protein DedA with SNARE-associated domain